MTNLDFTDLYNNVLPGVAGVSNAVALNAIRLSAIEFCDRSKVWDYDQPLISSAALTGNYAFQPDGNSTEVVGVKQAWYNGLPIEFRTPAQLEIEQALYDEALSYGTPWTDITGTPLFYTILKPSEFVLCPKPDTAYANAIKMSILLKPIRTATGMEDWILNQYREQIAAGALYRLYAMPNKPWSNPQLASFNKGEFEKGIKDAGAINMQTVKLPPLLVDPSPI